MFIVYEIRRGTRRSSERARLDPQGIWDAQIFQFLFATVSADADAAFSVYNTTQFYSYTMIPDM